MILTILFISILSKLRNPEYYLECDLTDVLLQVLEGVDPVTEELGPYVYSATHVRRIIEVTQHWAENCCFTQSLVSDG